MPDGGEHICTGFQKFGDVIGIVLAVMIRIAARRSTAQKLSVKIEKIIVVRRHIDLGQIQVCS